MKSKSKKAGTAMIPNFKIVTENLAKKRLCCPTHLCESVMLLFSGRGCRTSKFDLSKKSKSNHIVTHLRELVDRVQNVYITISEKEHCAIKLLSFRDSFQAEFEPHADDPRLGVNIGFTMQYL